MRIQEIIRSVLDLIDNIENNIQDTPSQNNVIDPSASPLTHSGDDINRFKQIIDLHNDSDSDEYDNEPCPAYADLDAVTVDAGGGMNGPKHPVDIRVKDPSAYPEYKQTEFENPVNDKHVVHVAMLKTLGGIK